ncbi:type II toxin-antitoxin system HicA family toxin [Photorhabdus noenieputensis]|uniref:type II toxin-antitoxin system HicA family toxin n=1 Tax=Photorhabdus noenieputensis TaxID=1208607 RepID=UPI001BD1F3E1|nr:type II toxin-antitoxin system HicA family toxin [Photorhabdus noenieputensis]MBS9438300.1 type II toxin-antitoxin system HicA family toxin [Photorhabdus noenieputensis]MCK3669840.1 type II toxin-antitoxin system HicA family toxin [Photorhabdus noenieputensis]
MKYSEFRRWLISQGVLIEKARGGGSHRKVSINGKSLVFPDHGSKEIPEPLRKKIMKDLGL